VIGVRREHDCGAHVPQVLQQAIAVHDGGLTPEAGPGEAAVESL